ncbi:MAG TPA: hypothetical protein VKW04_06475 [Planctomycetota bacterium]|nr:hypothetical protein [Planctomycetota bacterium]
MKRGIPRAFSLALMLALSRTSLAGDPPRATLETFRAAMKEARSIEDRAVQIQALGTANPGEPGVVAELSRFLVQAPMDINLLLPVTAAAALGRMRGNRVAALTLVQALPSFRKTPYVYRRMIAALGQVGHETVLPTLQDLLTGNEAEPAMLAADALAELPADLALDALLKGWDGMQKRRAKVGDDVKKIHDRVGLEILRLVQKISGEKYPTLTEMQVWWTRRAPKWKDIAVDREREREQSRQAVPPAQELPAVVLVELLFNEGGGPSTANLGSSSAAFASAILTKNKPAWSHEIPPPGNASSLDWGAEPGPFAVDMAGSLDHLKNLKSFTITGWLNARSSIEGPGGNRLMSWLDRDGVEIVHRSDGSLQIGINQKAEASAIRTPPQQIPAVDPTAVNALFMNWRFFAVTYDSTAASSNAKIYVGNRDVDAALIVQRDCLAGSTGPRIAAGLSIGNVPAGQRAILPKASFRGLMDEIRIFGSTRDGSGALTLPAIVLVQARAPAPP